MGGGILQLSAYGSQDTYLTGNPQITYFKSVYYRYTNFSIESIENTFDTDPGFGRKVSSTISKTGDLIHKIYLVVDIPKLAQPSGNGEYIGWTNKLGHALIRNVDISIGGELIDKHNSEWLEIWSSLTTPESKRDAYKKLIGEYDGGIIEADESGGNRVGKPGFQANQDPGQIISGASSQRLYIPLQFWFCKKIGSSLPIISLPHQDVKINIDFRNLNELIKADSSRNVYQDGTTNTPTFNASLFVDYIYLDTKERQIFTEKNHEYVIEQVQYDGEESISLGGNTKHTTTLSFVQPVKELFWVITNEDRLTKSQSGQGNSLLDFSTYQGSDRKTTDEFDTAVLKINGVDRFTPRDPLYFRAVQPMQYHTNAPLEKYIYCYSFCINPEDLQPSGSCNFSMLDTAMLQLNYTSSNSTRSDNASRLKVFALNYNVLRIMSGMCGLAYSN